VSRFFFSINGIIGEHLGCFLFTSSDMDLSFHAIWTYKENCVDLITFNLEL